jgi:hypothetical protein
MTDRQIRVLLRSPVTTMSTRRLPHWLHTSRACQSGDRHPGMDRRSRSDRAPESDGGVERAELSLAACCWLHQVNKPRVPVMKIVGGSLFAFLLSVLALFSNTARADYYHHHYVSHHYNHHAARYSHHDYR